MKHADTAGIKIKKHMLFLKSNIKTMHHSPGQCGSVGHFPMYQKDNVIIEMLGFEHQNKAECGMITINLVITLGKTELGY